MSWKNWQQLKDLLVSRGSQPLVLVISIRKNSYSVHLIGNSQRSLTGMYLFAKQNFVCMKLLAHGCSTQRAWQPLFFMAWMMKQKLYHSLWLKYFLIYIRIHCNKIIPLAIWNRTLLPPWKLLTVWETWGHKSSSSQWRIKINSLYLIH